MTINKLQTAISAVKEEMAAQQVGGWGLGAGWVVGGGGGVTGPGGLGDGACEGWVMGHVRAG